MLVVFGGLPGVGKTTIAQQVAHACGATYLRIDTIEQSIRSAHVLAKDVGPAGYLVAYEMAETNLRLGPIVVADCVNPLLITRQAWTSVAAAALCPILQIEITCSDQNMHRERIETRSIDIEGLMPPTWADVLDREYEPWPDASLRIDTAIISASDATSMIVSAINTRQA